MEEKNMSKSIFVLPPLENGGVISRTGLTFQNHVAVDIGILFIMVPVVTPIAKVLGFDAVWFAIMLNVNLQMSFLTPPFALAVFFLRGVIPEEYGINTNDIIRGVIPFIVLICVGLGLCIAFPQIILWLPSIMVK